MLCLLLFSVCNTLKFFQRKSLKQLFDTLEFHLGEISRPLQLLFLSGSGFEKSRDGRSACVFVVVGPGRKKNCQVCCKINWPQEAKQLNQVTVAAFSSSKRSHVLQLNLSKTGYPNTLSMCLCNQETVLGSPGYPDPNLREVIPSSPLSAKDHLDKIRSRGTLAQMEAADTIGYNESAFLETVILTPGKILASFCWYTSGGPTVSM